MTLDWMDRTWRKSCSHRRAKSSWKTQWDQVITKVILENWILSYWGHMASMILEENNITRWGLLGKEQPTEKNKYRYLLLV